MLGITGLDESVGRSIKHQIRQGITEQLVRFINQASEEIVLLVMIFTHPGFLSTTSRKQQDNHTSSQLVEWVPGRVHPMTALLQTRRESACHPFSIDPSSPTDRAEWSQQSYYHTCLY